MAQLPQNLEAEMSVLGAIFLCPESFEVAAEVLDADDFHSEKHRAVYAAIEELVEGRKPIDVVTVGNVLKAHGKFDDVGGPGYIADVADYVPTAKNIGQYAAIVREKAILRGLIASCSEIAANAYEAGEPGELLDVMEYEAARLQAQRVTAPTETKSSVLAQVLWKLEHRQDDSVPTGFPALDQTFGGFNIGHLTILAARTSNGKTALATNFALNAAKHGSQVAFFTLEMTAEEMWQRALACESGVNLFETKRRGYRSSQDAESVRIASALMNQLPLQILYRPAMQPRALKLECRRLQREMGGLKLVVVDYFNLMRGNRREKERWREMQEAILELKQLAGELGVPMLLLSQLNREVDEKHCPSLVHLRDTGATEEHASNVLFLWQPEQGPILGTDEHQVELLIAKARNGPAGLRIPMRFNKSCGAFA